MHQVQLPDNLYQRAQKRATDAGFSTVDDYIADMLAEELTEESIDALFTPERLSRIDNAAAEIKGGNFFTPQQADAELAKRRAEWLHKNPR